MPPPIPNLADTFLSSQDALHPENATAALLVLSDGRYVLQLRDAKSTIFYPNHWGCFGGASLRDEPPLDSIRRELHEELNIDVAESDCRYFTNFTFDLRFCGRSFVSRQYFLITIPCKVFDRIELTEGVAAVAIPPVVALTTIRMVPYDAFAIWLHQNSERISGEAPADTTISQAN